MAVAGSGPRTMKVRVHPSRPSSLEYRPSFEASLSAVSTRGFIVLPYSSTTSLPRSNLMLCRTYLVEKAHLPRTLS